MMTTDSERCKVATRLRELPTDMYEVEELWEMKGLDTCCKDQTDYYLIHFVLFGCFPVDHMHPCDYEELHMRLAGIIEPEPERACRNVSTVKGKFTCSSCHQSWRHVESLNGRIAYCPCCGAKVVDDGD